MEMIDVLNKLQETITSKYCYDIFHLSYKQTKVLDTIYAFTRVLKKKSDYNGIWLEVEGSRESLEKIRQILDSK